MAPGPSSVGTELQTTIELLHRLFLEVEGADASMRKSSRIEEILLALRRQPNLAGLPKKLLRVYAELAEALNGIRLTRETIQAYSVERLRDTQMRLNAVSSTTESAAIEMLNGLDRTLAMIDQLEGSQREAPSHEMCDALRSEVNQLYGCLQFQDIIGQQLRGAAGLLLEVEQRVETVASLFDESHGARSVDLPSEAPASYNPDASMRDTASRQAMIDEAFSLARRSAPSNPFVTG